MIKQYLGIILSVIYALLIRVLAEWDIIEINSLAYLLITPMAMGFIPFYFKGGSFRKSILVAIFYPLMGTFLFLLIAVVTRLEDIICFIIVGAPYIGVSVIVSLVLFLITTDSGKDEIKKGSLSVLLLPLLLGQLEKELPKVKTDLTVSNSIVIDLTDTLIWGQLFEVPDLSKANVPGWLNYAGVPQPVRSVYDAKSNTRLGYFENDLVLKESVVEQIPGRKLVFAIDLKGSRLGSNPTMNHILKTKNMEFRYIQYELKKRGNDKTLLKLSTSYRIHSNLPAYGKFWSTRIIADFEQKLLTSLKTTLEKQTR